MSVVNFPGKGTSTLQPPTGGDGMDDVVRRLGALESQIAEVRVDLATVSTTVVHLATKEDVKSVQVAVVQWLVATMIAAAGLAATIAGLINHYVR